MDTISNYGGGGMAAYYTVMLFCLLVPLCVGIILALTKRGSLLALAMGAVTFLVFQILTRSPILSVLPYVFPGLQTMQQGSAGYWAYVVMLCFTAGLFEEMGRYIVMRFVLKKRRGMWNGVVFGIGHGGFEAFVLVGLNYLIYLILDFLPQGALGAQVPTAQQIVATTSASNILMAGAERVSAIIFHVSMSMIIMRMVMSGKGWMYVFIPVAAHGVFNLAGMMMMSLGGFTVLGVEMALLAMALLSMAAALYYWRAVEEDELLLKGVMPEDMPMDDAFADDVFDAHVADGDVAVGGTLQSNVTVGGETTEDAAADADAAVDSQERE